MIVPSTIVSGIALGLFMLAPSYAWFLVACVVWSLAVGASGAARAAYVADIAPPGMNAAAMSAYRTFSDIGYVLGPIALGLVTDVAGPNTALALTALLLVAIALVFARFAPRDLHHHPFLTTKRNREAAAEPPRSSAGFAGAILGGGRPKCGPSGPHTAVGRGALPPSEIRLRPSRRW